MSELTDLVLSETDDKMHKAVAHTRAEFSNVRTGRASASIIEKLTVDAYGADTPLQTHASFSVPEARLLVVSPYDTALMPNIEKAIRNSDLGLNPSNDGPVIRLAFPPLTEERRRDFVKRVKHQAEEGKVAIRNLRRAARHELDALVKDGDATE